MDIYRRVVADPMANGASSMELVAQARLALREERAGGAEALVAALRARAWFEHARLANRAARPLLTEAADLARRHRLDDRLREVLVTRAAVSLELGDQAAARRDLVTALNGAGSDPPPELGLQQASLFYNTGQLQTAAQLCRRALGDPDAPAELRAKVANNLAIITVQQGRPDAALELLDLADELAAPAAPALVAAFASSRAWVLAQGGRLGESMRQFAAAETLFAAAGLPTAELLLEQLDALVDLRLLPEAVALADRAVAEFGAHDLALMAGDARYRSARVVLIAGDAPGALQLARAVVAEFRRQRRPGWTARAETLAVHAAWEMGSATAADLTAVRRAARVLDRLGLRAAAVDAHLVAGRVALARSRRRVGLAHLAAAQHGSARGSVLVRLRGRLAAALAAQACDDDRAALRHSRAGLAALSRHRAALGSMELRALASGHGVELGQVGLGVLRNSGSAADVLGWMERIRAASLLTVAPQAGAEVRAPLAALGAVQAELDAVRAQSRPEPAALLARQAALETEVRRISWQHTSEHDPGGRPVALREARRVLDGRTLVGFGVDGPALFAAVLTAHRTRLVPLGRATEVRAESDALLFALRRLTRAGPPRSLEAARASADHALRRLRMLLLAPLDLDAGTPIVVIPAAVAGHVAWSALHPAAVAVAPSVSLWARSVSARPSPTARVVLVAGPGLPGATSEVERLATLHPGAAVLVPPQSTVSAVSALLDGADLAHLACHGLLRLDNPTFSALQLSGGNLSLHELDQRAAPRRVVLAACDSATGVGYAGDEVLGFVGALMARGSCGVVASVAPVGDVEAVELNAALHVGLRDGLSMADAVWRSRAGIDRADPRSFVNWCATTAFGGG